MSDAVARAARLTAFLRAVMDDPDGGETLKERMHAAIEGPAELVEEFCDQFVATLDSSDAEGAINQLRAMVAEAEESLRGAFDELLEKVAAASMSPGALTEKAKQPRKRRAGGAGTSTDSSVTNGGGYGHTGEAE